MDNMFTDALQDLLRDQCPPDVVRRIEAGESASTLWQALENSGFADALVSDAHGGAGLALVDVAPLLELCGRHAVPVPLAETMLARGLLAAAGIPRPEGSIALAPGRLDDAGQWCCQGVPSGRLADHVLTATADGCRLLPVATARCEPGGMGLDASLHWPRSEWHSVAPLAISPDIFTAQAAILAVQLAGALTAVFERTLAYANERQQFGKPIGRFQAIQHQLSVMAEHVFAARMAALGGMRETGLAFDRLKVAVAKARASEAVVEVAALGHSIHGAIGFTREYDLQLHTRRLHAWRQAGGSESYWHEVLGDALVELGAPSLDLLRHLTDVADAAPMAETP